MKRLFSLCVVVLMFLLSAPFGLLHAQAPVSYPGDTADTIKRRAQWIEGAKKEGALNWWGVLKPDQGNRLLAEFNTTYPFIKGNFWRGRGEEIAAKLEAEYSGGRSSADITLGGEPYNYPRWRKMGILESYVNIIPGIEKIPKATYGRYGDWIQPGQSPKVMQYNTKLVSPAEAPKNWEDLLNPKWRKQISLQPDMNIWNIFALTEGGWGVEKTDNFLKKIKQQEPIWASGASAGHSLLVAGEFKIFGDSNLINFFLVQGKNLPVQWVRANPIPVSGPSFLLMKKAPNPNAARLFIEWLFVPQRLALYEKVTGYGAAFPGSGTRMAKALEGLDIINRTEEVELKAIEMGLSDRFAKTLGVVP